MVLAEKMADHECEKSLEHFADNGEFQDLLFVPVDFLSYLELVLTVSFVWL